MVLTTIEQLVQNCHAILIDSLQIKQVEGTFDQKSSDKIMKHKGEMWCNKSAKMHNDCAWSSKTDYCLFFLEIKPTTIFFCIDKTNYYLYKTFDGPCALALNNMGPTELSWASLCRSKFMHMLTYPENIRNASHKYRIAWDGKEQFNDKKVACTSCLQCLILQCTTAGLVLRKFFSENRKVLISRKIRIHREVY